MKREREVQVETSPPKFHSTALPSGEIRAFLAVLGPIAGAGLPGLILASGSRLVATTAEDRLSF